MENENVGLSNMEDTYSGFTAKTLLVIFAASFAEFAFYTAGYHAAQSAPLSSPVTSPALRNVLGEIDKLYPATSSSRDALEEVDTPLMGCVEGGKSCGVQSFGVNKMSACETCCSGSNNYTWKQDGWYTVYYCK